MKITVCRRGHADFAVQAEPSETIGELKLKISAEHGHPVKRQMLLPSKFSSRTLRDHWTIESCYIKDGGTIFLAVTNRDTDEFILYWPEDREKIRALAARRAGNSSLSNDTHNVAIAPPSISAFKKPMVPAQDSAPNSGHPDQAFKSSDAPARSEDQPVYGAAQPSDSTTGLLSPYMHTATTSDSDLHEKPVQRQGHDSWGRFWRCKWFWRWLRNGRYGARSPSKFRHSEFYREKCCE